MYDKTVYSTEKALYHRDKMTTLMDGGQPYPTHVEIIISDYCKGFLHRDCFFCAYRMSGYTSNSMFQEEEGTSRKARNPRRMLETKKVMEIIDDCAEMGVSAIQFTGGGEPTIHPDFIPIVAYAQGKGIDTALVTNGNMLHDEEHRKLVLNMAWVRISVDAGTVGRYREDRGVGATAWHRMCEAVKQLSDDREERRNANPEWQGPVIGIGFVVNPQNYLEIYQAVGMYSEWGVDNVRLGLMFNPDDMTPFNEIRGEIATQSNSAVRDFHVDGKFAVINRTAEKMEDLENQNPEYEFCGFQNFTTYIGGDLNVYRCCVYAYHQHGLVGSLKDIGLKEFWESQAKKDDFDGFKATSCERCQFNDINRAINAGMDNPSLIPLEGAEAPFHGNFV